MCHLIPPSRLCIHPSHAFAGHEALDTLGRLGYYDENGLTKFGTCALGSRNVMLPVDLHTAFLASPMPVKDYVASCVSVLAAVRSLGTYDFLADVIRDLGQLANLLHTGQSLSPPAKQTVKLAKQYRKLLADEFKFCSTPAKLAPDSLRPLWQHFMNVFENVWDGSVKSMEGGGSLHWVLSHSQKV